MTGDCDFLTGRRGLYNRADLLRFRADREFLTVLKNRVELIIVDNALACESCNQTAALRPLNMILFDQMPQQRAVIILRDAVERL